MKQVGLAFLCSVLLQGILYTQDSSVTQRSSLSSHITKEEISNNKDHLQSVTELPQQASPATIKFAFNDEPLVDIIYLMASYKGLNIIIPAGANTITTKITLHWPNLMDIDTAWDRFLTILDIAGYSIVPKGGDLHMIVPNNKGLVREPLPFYVGVSPATLPNTDERIRVLHFLTNLRASTSPDSEIPVILKEMLPDISSYQIDEKSNSILISGKASDIREVLEIINALDQTSFRERFEVVSLTHTSAEVVANLFTNILQEDRGPGRYKIDPKKEPDASFFSKNVKIVPEKRLNKLFLLGKEQAVIRIKEFIRKHIDVEMDSGKSILHVHQLQYLDSAPFAKVLENIVESRRIGGTGQSTGASAAGATERFFEGVIIQTDKPTSASAGYFGGNKLIVAAKNDDWAVIKKLIEQLDQPQPQVIIELLIADLTIDQTKALASITRNPLALPVPGTSSFQSAQISSSGVVLDPPPFNAGTNVASDLLASTDVTANPASTTTPGSMVLSINDKDGRTWSLTQLLQRFNYRKVIAHPHVVVTNNSKATITIGETRLLPDEAVSSSASTTVPFREQNANLDVNITPRISAADVVNLNIDIDITQWLPTTAVAQETPPRLTRHVQTSTNVKSGDILALGGLLRTDITNSGRQSPILGNIPILGWLTKGRDRRDIGSNLTVFISVIIVPARLRGGAGEYTKEHISIAQRYSEAGELFDSLRDPITRFFFRNEIVDNQDPFVEFMGSESTAKGTIPDIDVLEMKQEGMTPVPSYNPLDETVSTKEESAKTEKTPSVTERKNRLTRLLG